jgi:hypothetical protein
VVWAEGKIWRVNPFKNTAAEIPFHVKDSANCASRRASADGPEHSRCTSCAAPRCRRTASGSLPRHWARSTGRFARRRRRAA